jgi:hypothetical protein
MSHHRRTPTFQAVGIPLDPSMAQIRQCVSEYGCLPQGTLLHCCCCCCCCCCTVLLHCCCSVVQCVSENGCLPQGTLVTISWNVVSYTVCTVLQCCCTVIVLLFHRSYTLVTLLLHFCYIAVKNLCLSYRERVRQGERAASQRHAPVRPARLRQDHANASYCA